MLHAEQFAEFSPKTLLHHAARTSALPVHRSARPKGDETRVSNAIANLPTCYHREEVADLLNLLQKPDSDFVETPS